MTLGHNVIKRFIAVIYHHPVVISSFFVIELNYRGNYFGMEVNYCGILTLEKVGLKFLLLYFTMVWFYNIGPRSQC